MNLNGERLVRSIKPTVCPQSAGVINRFWQLCDYVYNVQNRLSGEYVSAIIETIIKQSD